MKPGLVSLVLAVISLGCAHPSASEWMQMHPTRGLVVRAPRTIIGDLNPREYRIYLQVKTWPDVPANRYDGGRRYPVYCDVRKDVIECLGGQIDVQNAEFELHAVWYHADDYLKAIDEHWSRIVEPFCGEIQVGVSLNGSGWSGDQAAADQWLEVKPRRDSLQQCHYHVPRELLTASKRDLLIASRPCP